MIASWSRVVNEPAPSQPASYNQALTNIQTEFRVVAVGNFPITILGKRKKVFGADLMPQMVNKRKDNIFKRFTPDVVS